mgnify:CR=1 FL=1
MDTAQTMEVEPQRELVLDRAAVGKSSSGFRLVYGWNGDNEISSISNESNKILRLYANDGATGARFLQTMKGMLENPLALVY